MSTNEPHGISKEDLCDYKNAFTESLEENITNLSKSHVNPFDLITAMDFLEDSAEFNDFDFYKQNVKKLHQLASLVTQHVLNITEHCDKLEGGCACIFDQNDGKKCAEIHIHSHRAEYISDMVRFQNNLPM